MDDLLHPQLAFLSPKKRQLLELRLRREQGGTLQEGTLKRRADRDGSIPLSPPQQQLWFVDQMEGSSAHYNVPVAMRLRGHVNGGAFERAWQEIMRRHDVLRTTFHAEAGQPVQVIHPFHLPQIEHFTVESEAEVLRIIQEVAYRPFDLTRDYLLRLLLLHKTDDEHVFVFVSHHIAVDGWSINVMVQELATLYTAYLRGEPSPLPTLPLHYADYSLWQREWLQGQAYQRHLDYWRQQLAGIPALLELPTDHPRPAVQSFRGSYQLMTLSGELLQDLHAIGRQQNVTLFMLLLSAFYVLLWRYSLQNDLVVGTPIANRAHAETQHVLGYFANMLVLRAQLGANLPFTHLLEEVRAMTLQAYAHQNMPFEQLVGELNPERHLAYTPLFQALFNVQQAPASVLSLPDLQVELLHLESQIAKFDLSMSIIEKPDQLLVSLEYSTDLFDAPTIERLLCQYRCLLEAVVQLPESTVAALPLLNTSEHLSLVRQWNEQPQESKVEQACIHELIEAQAAHTPDAIALSLPASGQQLSYQQLDHRSNQLARYLRRQQVGIETRVGLFVERSADVFVALLAIMKAGGVYVPLDPALPMERVRAIVADAGISLILSVHSREPELTVPLLSLAQESMHSASEDDSHLDSGVCSEHLAYILYTSGSTGDPKGVAVPHRGVVNYCLDMSRTYHYQPHDRVLQFASLSFDTSCEEIYPTWFAGATLVVRDEEMAASLAIFTRTIAAWRISIVNVPTAFWHLWCHQLSQEEALANSVRLVVVGGEQAQAQALRQWSAYAGSTVRWINTYGPTEASIVATRYDPVQHGSAMEAGVPIGRPVANTQVYLLDSLGLPVPPGMIGELYIGGRGVSRGYLGLAEQTAERFVPDAFGADPGARLYRTGDRARFLPDGNFVFVGRTDRQIKLRGYRIDLDEIAAILRRSPLVKDALADVYQGKHGAQEHLVAYIIRHEGMGISSNDDVRHFAQEHVPAYMVPTLFIEVASFPLNRHGKIAWHALPDPEVYLRASDDRIRGTVTDDMVKQMVRQIWADVLQITEIDTRTSFFASGGHSLLVISLIARLNALFHVDLSVRTLFDHPTIDGLVGTIKELRSNTHRIDEIVPRADPQSLAPLSFAQQRLWFLDRFEPESALYHIPLLLRVQGSLDLVAFTQAFNAVVHRHEILRTIFVERDGQPYQQILPTWHLEPVVHDLCDTADEQRERLARQQIQAAILVPFTLSQQPALRLHLWRLGEDEQVVLIVLHHILFDGWSSQLLWRELAQVYEAIHAGTSTALPDLPIQYADVALWQRNWLQGEVRQRLEDYWLRQLEGAPALITLPTDHPRPEQPSFRGGMRLWEVPEELARGLQRCARKQEVTLFMLLLAGLAVVLSRWSGQDEVVIGTPIANRRNKEMQELIGCFINMLALRVSLSGEPGFAEVLQQVREQALEAYEHQDLPFEALVERLNPPRQPGAHPVFQVLLNVQQSEPEQRHQEIGGLLWQPEPLEGTHAKFDLNLTIHVLGSNMRLLLEYSRDLYEPERIERLLSSYTCVLEAVVNDTEQSVARLPLLSPSQQTWLTQLNQEGPATEPPVTIPELVEQQARLRPEALAVIWEEEQLTYRELNTRANQLARYLHEQHGVAPEVRVGVCLERSLDLIIALLAILKAGGVYVPLDPGYPSERLHYLLNDSGIEVLLTQEHLRPLFESATGTLLHIADVHGEAALIACLPKHNLSLPLSPQMLAYSIYTSGSTGQPKGTLMTHANVAHLLQATQKECHFGPRDRWSLFHAYAFDFSVWEIWGSLCTGGCLVIVPFWTARDPQAFTDLLLARQITILNQTPSAFLRLVLLEEGQRRLDASALRLIIFGGEALDPALVRRWFALHPHSGPALLNMYGITETTVHVTRQWIERAEVEHEQTSVIGRPIDGWQVYILDRYMQPVPVGAPGELYIGGYGLARGYWQRADLTAERFLPHPWSTQPGERLYKTGDIGRYRADGSIEYLGRGDRQVKIRGFRVELGEIEAALQQEVGACVVMAQTDAEGELQLVAYVAHQSAHLVSPSLQQSWRSQLRQRLPDYMVPTRFVLVAAFPLTPSGKVDHRALVHMDAILPTEDVRDSEPTLTMTEQLLAQIWSEVLHLPQIDVQANFFEQGGHSLLAIALLARVRAVFQRELPVRALFEAPTVAGLAHRIETERRRELVKSQPLVPRADPQALVPLSFAQQRLWFLDRFEPESALYHIPLLLRVQGTLDLVAFTQAFNAVVHRHEILRTIFVERDGQPYQQILPTWHLEPVAHDLCDTANEQRERLARQQIQAAILAPFTLSQQPALRLHLWRLGEDEQVGLIVLHHILFDGWSSQLLWRELAQVYEAIHAGTSTALPDLPIQYADVALWQRNWLQGEVQQRLEDYWLRQLEGAPALITLPTDHPRPEQPSFRGGTQLWEVPEELARGLQRCARKQEVTLFMLLLAGLAVVLSRWSGQDEVVIGTPIANRWNKETQELIGCFINTLALRVSLSGEPGFAEILQQVRERALEAYEHQDLPFEALVERLNPPRQPGAHPVFQVLLNVQQSEPGLRQEVGGVSWQAEPSEGAHAKFDLNIAVWIQETRLSVAVEYSRDLYEPERIERLLSSYACVLEAVVNDTEQSVARLPLLGSTEQAWLAQLNQAHLVAEPLTTLPALIEQQVEQQPDALALVADEGTLTYRELDTRANQLAHLLLEQGLQLEQPVGIALERSLDLIVSMLAILKAGGAYAPLDPTLPSQRLSFYLQDAHIELLLTHSNLLAGFPSFDGTVLCLDLLHQQLSQSEEQAPERPITPANLAYIIYTSGSTGQPKGVMNTHAGICNRLLWMREQYRLGSHEHWLQKTPSSFDVSVAEIFCPLISGARLVLARPEGQKDPAYLVQLIQRAQISTVHFVPSMLRFFLEEPGVEACSSLVRVMCSGEALTPELQEQCFARLPGVELHNLYGPTEAAVEVSFWHCQRGGAPGQVVPIGRPLSQVSLYVLDEQVQLVPPGVEGDLYIGGVQVARGYVGAAERTAEAFLPDPFAEGGRLYRTGDRARLRPDGVIEYLGRRDHQVKMRGFRIELGEIEAALRQCEGVTECVVMAVKASEEQLLVAYVLCDIDEDNTQIQAHWRSQLQQRLPDYMVPVQFVLLPALQLNAHGKIDRNNLPAPAMRSSAPEGASGQHIWPRDEIEEQLVHIWERLLNVQPVGVRDNFFMLGGHSFSALRLMTEVRTHFGRQVPLATFFQQATIEHLAQTLKRPAGSELSVSVSEIQAPAQAGKQPLFWIYPPGIDTPVYHRLTRAMAIANPCYGFHLPDWKQYSCIEDIAAFHLASLRSIQPQGPYLIGGWSIGGVIAFEMARQLRATGEELRPLLLLDSSIQPYEQEEESRPLLYASFLYHLGLSLTDIQPFWTDTIIAKNEEEFLCDVLQLVRQHHTMPYDIRLADIEHLFAVYRWSLRLLQAYRPGSYDSQIALFKANESAVEPEESWQQLFAAHTSIYPVSGNHQSMLYEPHSQVLAEQLACIISNRDV